MLGGTVVNITGPCFNESQKIKCRFEHEVVIGTVIDRNRAICVQPFLKYEGYIRFYIAIDSGTYDWKGKYFVGEISVAPLSRMGYHPRVFFFSNCIDHSRCHCITRYKSA